MPELPLGSRNGYRKISLGPNGDLEPRLGVCPPSGYALSQPLSEQSVELITVDFSGFVDILDPALMENGAMPTLVGTSNHSVVLRRDDAGGRLWTGWSGPAQSQRIGGTQKTMLTRSAADVYILASFLLLAPADGTRVLVQYYMSGGPYLSRVLAGEAVTLANRAGTNDKLPSCLANATGSARIHR